jgi:hypothetical protein
MPPSLICITEIPRSAQALFRGTRTSCNFNTPYAVSTPYYRIFTEIYKSYCIGPHPRGTGADRRRFYFLILPSSFMMASYSTIFFFTRAREASGPMNSVLKPF